MPTLITIPSPDYGASARPVWAHKVEENEQGQPIKVRAMRSRPLWALDMAWQARAYATLATFQDDLHGLRDQYTECCVWTPSPWERWTLCAVGTGDGSTAEFVFGAKDMASGSIVVTVDGAAETHFTAAAKGGDSAGRWALTFGTGYEPGDGLQILCSFNGRRLLRGRFGAERRITTPTYQLQGLAVSFLGYEVETIA